MSKFTPGPWFASQSGYEFALRKSHCVVDNNRCMIADLPDAAGDSREANARLIAHAPVLFQIAEATLELYEQAKLGEMSPEAKKFEDTLRAVIASVKGEE